NQHQHQQNRRSYIGEPRRRAAAGYLSGSNASGNDGSTAVPTLEQGGYGGFNGIVFGSGGNTGLSAGNQGDLGGALGSRLSYDNGASHDTLGIYGNQGLHRLSEPPQATAGPFAHHRQGHSSAIEQVGALLRENQMLRKQNQALLAASDARQRAVFRLLKQTAAADEETQDGDVSGQGDGQRKKQLTQLLLALLDTSPEQGTAEARSEDGALQTLQQEPESTAQPSIGNKNSSSSERSNSNGSSNERSNSAGPPRCLSSNQSSRSPRIQPADAEHAFRQQSSRPSEPAPPGETRANDSPSRQPDWDTGALLEISSQGHLADGELEGDTYAKETRKAIGTHQYGASARRRVSLSRRRSSLLSMYSTHPPEIAASQTAQQSMHPGAFPGSGSVG
ncbi:hypothetical protein LPJ56_006346, partial [Coemansia sp. RSA 2599]